MITHGAYTGANVNTIEGELDAYLLKYLFQRMMVNARDAAVPTAWGGAGETESAWMTALLSDFGAAAARRCLVSAGHYNMASIVGNPSSTGFPIMRRPASWAFMARRIGGGGGSAGPLPVQSLGSAPVLGQLDQVVVDPTNDSSDGFIYHDEAINPGLNDGRFATLWTRNGMGQGFFERSENLMSPLGSDFDLYPRGQCFDNFCGVLQRFFVNAIDLSVLRNTDGTIAEADAQRLERRAMVAVGAAIPGQFDPVGTSVVIDRGYNVKLNQKLLVTGNFGGLTYIREIDLTAQMA